jgi:3,4-dihydroxy 2-butanone 4-phosphate synthase
MIREALRDLAAGKPILLYDLDGREEETDMVVAGRMATPGMVARLRRDAGGLICIAVPRAIAARLGLPYLHDIFMKSDSDTLRSISAAKNPYGGHPAFSVTINHRDTYTGITDRDRSKTLTEFAALVGEMSRTTNGRWANVFRERFRSPGHVHVLIGSSLHERQGHTELSLRLSELSSLPPAMVICEMLDGESHMALGKDDAAAYARSHGLVLIEAKDLLETTEESR